MKNINPTLNHTVTLILLLALSTATFSCKKTTDDNTPVNNVSVSGLFRGDTFLLNDSVTAQVIFSFDELEDGTVNGGLRIHIVGNKENYSRTHYKSGHSLAKWEETADGNSLIAGEANMGEELGVVAFAGTIVGNETFDYTLAGNGFADEKTATYIGEYVRNNGSKSTTTTDYTGSYSISCGGASIENCLAGYYTCGTYDITMVVTGQTPDNYGGIELAGYFSGNIPELGSGNHNFNTEDGQSEVYGGYLSIETVGDNFYYYGCNTCTWDPSTTYSCDWGYAIYWTPDDTCGDIYGMYILQGNISMGAKE